MAKFCTKCGRQLQDGEVCTCSTVTAGNQAQAPQNQQGPQGQGYQQAPQNQQYQQAPQGQQFQQAPQGQQYQQAPQGQQYQEPVQAAPQNQQGPQGQGYQQAPQGQQYQQAPQNQQSQQAPQNQQAPQGQQYQQAPQNQQSQQAPQNQQNQQGPQGQQYQQGQGYQQGPQGQQFQQGPQGQQYQQGQGYQQGPQGQQYQQGPRNEWFNENKDAVVSGAKNMFAEIVPILKAPVTRIRELAAGGNQTVGVGFIIAKAAVGLLLYLIGIIRIKLMMGPYSSMVKIPWFQLLVMVLVLTAGSDFLDTFLLKTFTGVFKGTANFKAMLAMAGGRALYQAMGLVVCGILSFISPNFAIYLWLIVLTFTRYLQHSVYGAVVQMEENKKLYAYFVARVCTTIIVCVVLWILLQLMASSIAGGFLGSLRGILGELY